MKSQSVRRRAIALIAPMAVVAATAIVPAGAEAVVVQNLKLCSGSTCQDVALPAGLPSLAGNVRTVVQAACLNVPSQPPTEVPEVAFVLPCQQYQSGTNLLFAGTQPGLLQVGASSGPDACDEYANALFITPRAGGQGEDAAGIVLTSAGCG